MITVTQVGLLTPDEFCDVKTLYIYFIIDMGIIFIHVLLLSNKIQQLQST